jgi:dTDP-4-amino-4,6-dideoxygalactose transaminase
MNVTFYDFPNLHNPDFKAEILNRYKEIIDENAFIEGKYNHSFEKKFAELQQSKHCLLLANGTDAIEIALLAEGIKAGDLVGVTSISFFATAEAVINVGATPVFIDVEPETGLICPESLKRILTKHSLKAIIPVHIYGMPAAISQIEEICKPQGIKIIEDGAQSQGGFYENGKPIGSSQNMVTYSFYPTKNLGAFGDAGAILTQNDHTAETVKSIRNHGRSPNGHAIIGRNSRCDHFQAAVLDLKMDTIEQQNIQRKEIAKKYFAVLKKLPIELVPEKYLELSSWHLFPIRAKNREEKYKLKDFLTENKIGSALFYEKAMAEELPLTQYAGEKENALNFAARTLCLPMNPFLTEEKIDLVAQTIAKFYS